MTASDGEPSTRSPWRWLVVVPMLFVEYVAVWGAILVGDGHTIYGHDDGDPVAGAMIGVIGSVPLVAALWFAGGWPAVAWVAGLVAAFAIAWAVGALAPVLAIVVAIGLLAVGWTLRSN